jgi:hypothetical protein
MRDIKGRTSHVLRQEFQVLRFVCRCKIRNFSEMRRSGSDSSWDRPETPGKAIALAPLQTFNRSQWFLRKG